MLITQTFLVVTVTALLCYPIAASASVINLGFGWQATAPDGYNVAPDEALNTLRFFPGTTTAAIPLKLIVANWSTTNPVAIKFTAPLNAQQDRFMLRMVVGNDTGLAWNGFSFDIRDTQVDYPNSTTAMRGSLLHPDRAHMH